MKFIFRDFAEHHIFVDKMTISVFIYHLLLSKRHIFLMHIVINSSMLSVLILSLIFDTSVESTTRCSKYCQICSTSFTPLSFFNWKSAHFCCYWISFYNCWRFLSLLFENSFFILAFC